MRSLHSTYILASKLLLFMFTTALIYPVVVYLFDLKMDCQYKLIFGKECRSCGLTRGLLSCIKFDFSKAYDFNQQSTFVFFFLISQISFRIALLYFSRKLHLNKPRNIITLISLDFAAFTSLLIFNLTHYG
jgi:hypothetical protein